MSHARLLLGGDLEIRLSRQISRDGLAYLASLSDRDIAMTHVSELIGMAAHVPGKQSGGQPSQIVELKAVESLYPFYGTLRLEPDRPLWELLPDGVLKRQLLGELAEQAQIEVRELSEVWSPARARSAAPIPAPAPHADAASSSGFRWQSAGVGFLLRGRP